MSLEGSLTQAGRLRSARLRIQPKPPWLLAEAGGLSRSLASCRVVSLLIASVALIALSAGSPAFAEDSAKIDVPAPKPFFFEAVFFDLSPPLEDLVTPLEGGHGEPARLYLEAPRTELPEPWESAPRSAHGAPRLELIGERDAATVRAPLSRDGLTSLDVAALDGIGRVPATPSSDVGERYIVQGVRGAWMIFDKISGSPVVEPIAGGDLWRGSGGLCATGSVRPVRVLYDPFAKRWLLAAVLDDAARLCVAVSVSPDPLGSYHRFEFEIPGQLNDLRLGLWPSTDAYLFAAEMGEREDTRTMMAALDRSAMLGGGPAGGVAVVPNSKLGLGFGAAPVDLDGHRLPRGIACAFFVQQWDDEITDFNSTLRLGRDRDGYLFWPLCPDFDSGAVSAMPPILVPVEVDWDSELCGFGPCLDQPGAEVPLGARSWSSGGRAQLSALEPGPDFGLLVAHTVDVGSEIAGVHWTQFDFNCLTSGQCLTAQDIRVVTSETLESAFEHRAFPSIAQDQAGHVAVAFTSIASEGAESGGSPSLRYAWQSEPGGEFNSEASCAIGGGARERSDQWSPSSIIVDSADGCTFWVTGEYLKAPGEDWSTRLCSFSSASCGAFCESLDTFERPFFSATFPSTPGRRVGPRCIYSARNASLSLAGFAISSAKLRFGLRADDGAVEGFEANWAGALSKSFAVGDATIELNLNQLSLKGGPKGDEIASVDGGATLSLGEKQVQLRLESRGMGLRLSGAGDLSFVAGGEPVSLHFDSLAFDVDGNGVRLAEVVGEAVIGDGAGDHLLLELGLQDGQLSFGGAGSLSGELGSVPFSLLLDDIQASYDFEDFRLTAASGTGRFGDEEGDHLILTVDFDEALSVLSLSGSGAVETSVGEVPLELQVESFLAHYDLESLSIVNVSGSGRFGSTGGNQIELSLGFDSELGKMMLTGSGLLDLEHGGIAMELQLSEFEATYDFHDFELLAASGRGSLGDPSGDRIALSLSYDSAARTLDLEGSGSLDLRLANVPLELELSEFAATYDFEEFLILAAAGRGRLGDPSADHLVISVDYNSASRSLVLSGSGQLASEVGTLPLALDLAELRLLYDFKEVHVSAASGSAVLGDPDGDHLSLDLDYDAASMAIALSGSGSLETSIGSSPLRLELTRFEASYDFERLRLSDAAGSAELGDPDGNHLSLVVSYDSDAGAALIEGQGELEAEVGAVPLSLDLASFRARTDLESIEVLEASGTATFGDPSGDHVVLTIAYDGGTLELNGSGRLTVQANSLELELVVVSLEASYDFEDFQLTGFEGNASLSKDGEVLAAAMLGLDGQVIKGQFTLSGQPGYTHNGFTVKVESFEIEAAYHLSNQDFRLLNGAAAFAVSGIEGVDGEIKLSLVVQDGGFEARVDASGSTIQAFGMTLEDLVLAVDFNADFELTAFEGQLSARHPSIDGVLTIKIFEVVDGKLRTFSLHGDVSYEGFSFALTEASYQMEILTISGKVAIEEIGQVSVQDFVIDAEGNVSVGSIEARIQTNPVDVRLSATFQESRFIGTISGTFTPTVMVDGELDIGSNGSPGDRWTHVYATLVLRVPGIPLGTTGLKVTRLGGAFGFNYDAQDGEPQRGTYGIGLTLGIADQADLFEIVGSAYVQFGPNVLIILEGTLSVPATSPVVQGVLNVSYEMPEAHVSGSLSTTIKIPSGSGSIVDIDQQKIFFDFQREDWTVEGRNLEGEILRALQLTDGVISFHRHGDQFRGELGGKASFSASGSVSIVDIDSCSSFWDGGLELNYSVSISGQFSTTFSNRHISGSFGIDASGSAGAKIKVPLYTECDTAGVSVEGNLRASVGDEICVSGSLTYHPEILWFDNTFNTGDLCI